MTRTARTSMPGILKQEISLQPGAEAANDASDQLSFWERIYSIAPEDWSKYFIYLYRGRGGANLEKINHPFDPEWVRQKYGGGEYRAMLNDEKYKMVASHIFAIEGPPKLAPHETQTSAAAPAPASDGFQTEVLKLIQENNRQTQDLLREVMNQARQPAPNPSANGNPLEIVKPILEGVVSMFKGMIPQQRDPLELIRLLKELQPAQPDLFSILIKAKEVGLIPSGANVGGNLLDQITMITEVANKLGLTAGGGKSMGEILLEKGPDIVREIGGLVDRYKDVEKTRLATVQTVATMQRNAAPAQAAQPGQPSAAPPAPAPQPGSALEVEPIGTPPQPQIQTPPSQALPLDGIDMLKQKIVEAIAKGSTGADIVSFLDIMDERLPNSFVGVPLQQLVEFFTADPILRNATQLPRFQVCLQEIVEVLNEVDAGSGMPN